MHTTTKTMVAAIFAVALFMPTVTAAPPGNVSRSFDVLVVSEFDFKDGVGIADPADPNNPCTSLLLGVRVPVGAVFYYQSLRVSANFVGPAVGVADRADVPLGVACPLPASPPSQLFAQFDGMNWYSGYLAMSNDVLLCGQMALAIGCAPVPSSQNVIGSACSWSAVSFGPSPDEKSAFWPAQAAIGSRDISCSSVDHSHDYSSYYESFAIGSAGTGFQLIRNADLAHPGAGSMYAIMCVSIDYDNLDDGVGPVLTSSSHDWNLILDVGNADAAAALQVHVGAGLPLLPGLYDLGGDNGFPCTLPGGDHDPKPAPIL